MKSTRKRASLDLVSFYSILIGWKKGAKFLSQSRSAEEIKFAYASESCKSSRIEYLRQSSENWLLYRIEFEC